MLLTISFAPSPSFMVELAVPKAGSVSGVSLGVGPPRNAAVRTAPAGAKEPRSSLGRLGLSRNSFRKLLCCPFFRFAKFHSKFDMLAFFFQPKFKPGVSKTP